MPNPPAHPPLVLVLADDLTGAIEAGAHFSAAGLPAQVTTRRAWDAAAPVCVIDTETRHSLPEEAAAVVAGLAAEARRLEPRLFYKKTDSTLRGNIVAELSALADQCPGRGLLYVPAYPRMGRTVKAGHLLVHGVPVHLTEFGRDPLNPIASSDVAGWFRGAAVRVHVEDAHTDEEIARAAERLLCAEGLLLAAGPAAFAQALACRMAGAAARAPVFPAVRRCLVVNGSLHPLSARQMAELCGCPDWIAFDAGNISATGTARALAVGDAVRPMLPSFDALAIFGGDTAFGILSALGCSRIWPYGEVLPGAPVSRVCAGGRELTLITKAGGFGPVDILPSMRKLLSKQET